MANEALRFRHAAELRRAELQLEKAARAAIEDWAERVLAASAVVGLDQAAAEQGQDWTEEIAAVLAVLFLVWRKRYRAAGGREDLLQLEWAKFSGRVRPQLVAARLTVLSQMKTGELTLREIIDGRAQVIAQTLSIAGYNGGASQGFFTTGEQGTKRWLSLRDQRVRETHREADGQVVPAGAFFTVGGSFGLYPGDPALPARETVNCRCIAIYEVV